MTIKKSHKKDINKICKWLNFQEAADQIARLFNVQFPRSNPFFWSKCITTKLAIMKHIGAKPIFNQNDHLDWF